MLCLRDTNVCAEMQRDGERGAVECDAVTFELTENRGFDRRESALAFPHAIREAGFGLALDGFGTGWSAIEHLAVLEIEFDRTFSSLAPKKKSVEAVAGPGRTFSLTLTTDGIESAPAISFVAAAGCDRAR